jgi:hypothetical protein
MVLDLINNDYTEIARSTSCPNIPHLKRGGKRVRHLPSKNAAGIGLLGIVLTSYNHILGRIGRVSGSLQTKLRSLVVHAWGEDWTKDYVVVHCNNQRSHLCRRHHCGCRRHVSPQVEPITERWTPQWSKVTRRSCWPQQEKRGEYINPAIDRLRRVAP